MRFVIYIILMLFLSITNLNANGTILGTIFEDISGDLLYDMDTNLHDNLGDQRALKEVKVYLYKDSNNNQILDTNDEINLSVITDINGTYSFNNIANGNYFVAVDSKTINPTANYVTGDLRDVWAEQTYAPVGGVCTDGNGIQIKKVTSGSCFGGREPSVSDNASLASLAQHIAYVSINDSNVTDLNFGFSFNVVTHTSDKDDDLNNLRTSQGSFRQFIQNSNAIKGANKMRFVPSIKTNGLSGGSWWRVVINNSLGLLPVIGDSETTIDATAYNFYNPAIKRDQNSGFIGMGGYVGIDQIPLDKIPLPELSIDFSNINQNYFCGLRVWSPKTKLSNFAIYGTTGTQLNSGAAICLVNDTVVTKMLIGTTANGDRPSNYGLRENERIGIKANRGVMEIFNNYFAYNGYGLVFECPNATSGCNANSIVYNNEFYKNGSNSDITGVKSDDGDSIALWHVSGINIQENLIRDTVANGVVRTDEGKGIEIWWDDTYHNEILNNTIIRATTAGIGFHNGAYQNIAMKNIITETLGDGTLNSGAGVLVGTTNQVAINNRISQNSIFKNHGASIDIDTTNWSLGDGVSANDGILSTSRSNHEVDYPIFTTVDINSTTSTVHVAGYIGDRKDNPNFANAIIEIYKADNDGNTNGEIIKGDLKSVPHGEGRWYLGSCQADSLSNFDCILNIPSNITLNSSDFLTATSTLTSGSTSEFSAVSAKVNDTNLLNATDESLVFDWNKPINTKIVNKAFNLTILAKDKNTNSPKSGVKITKLNLYRCDNTLEKASWWSGDKTTNANGLVTISNLIYDKALSCLFVNIEGNNTINKFDSNSSDKFAIRPKRYKITPIINSIKAGDSFDINITALDFNDNKISDYNATKITYKIDHNEIISSCSSGNLNFTKADFISGEAHISSAIYDNVGELNISIKDNNSSEFAKIDSPDPNRFIMPDSKDFSFGVGDFNLSWDFKNAGNEITYYSSDTTNMSSILKIDIKAVDIHGNLVTNFTNSCYAKDLNATIFYDINTSSTQTMLVRGSDTLDKDILHSSIDQNFTYHVDKSQFTSADINESIKINFKRAIDSALEPTFMKITDINITDGSISKNNPDDQNATFYYARAHAPDYITVGKDFDATIFYEVYCKNCDKDLFILAKGDESKDYINWYILPSSIYNSLDSSYTNAKPLSIIQSSSNDNMKLLAPTLPYQVQISYDPKSWLIFNRFSSTNTHKFVVKFNPTKRQWVGKGDVGLAVDTNISTQTNHKLNW